jgi:peroxin-19
MPTPATDACYYNNNNSSTDPDKSGFMDEVTKLMDSLSHGDFEKTLEELAQNMSKDMPDLPDLGDFDLSSTDNIDQLVNEMENKPEMQQMMSEVVEKLVSKDVLYEPMKEMRDQYPVYLTANKDKISAEEYTRCVKQQQIVTSICAAYEANPPNVMAVMDLMQQLQETGQPPTEIIKGLAPDMDMNEEGMPQLPEELGGKNCCVM